MYNQKLKLAYGGIKSSCLFEKIISLENLFLAWEEFKKGKNKKKDVQEFEKDFEKNILNIHNDLKNKTYKHSSYFSFYVKDPKLRHIHKACVRDRVLHHAVFRILYPIFEKSFIFDSYSCRLGKGTHKAVNRLQEFARKASKNNSKNIFVLKCDIKRFFASISSKILLSLVKERIKDKDTIWLVNKIIASFSEGIPLGNITSQLFANVYLDRLDKFIKHRLKIKYYIRYCDDFLILSANRNYLQNLIFVIDDFLRIKLRLYLHPNKVIIRKYRQGTDFLGYIIFPYHKILRIKTKKRMFRNIKLKKKKVNFNQILQSYFGMLKHCSSYKIKGEIVNLLL